MRTNSDSLAQTVIVCLDRHHLQSTIWKVRRGRSHTWEESASECRRRRWLQPLPRCPPRRRPLRGLANLLLDFVRAQHKKLGQEKQGSMPSYFTRSFHNRGCFYFSDDDCSKLILHQNTGSKDSHQFFNEGCHKPQLMM